MSACPACSGPRALDPGGVCPGCRGAWLDPSRLELLGPGGLAGLRRFVGRGPPTPLSCPRCRSALKAFDVPGPQYEGDLFWGLESPRPAGTCVAEGCSRCGGVWVAAADLQRAGGLASFLENLARTWREQA